MAIEYNFTLDMDRSKRDNNVAYARTGDIDSIVINADLVFGGAAYTPSGDNAFFECITPNGRSIRSAAEKTGSSVTVEVPPAAFQAAGVINVAYFRFESGETGNPTYVESTEPFAIVVREGIGDSIDAGDYIEDWRKLVDHLEVVVADVGQKAEQVEIAKAAAEKAKADAETAGTAAANSAESAASSASEAKSSATAAQQSAASVADKFIASAQATTLEPGSQATASVENQVLTIGVPKGEKGDKGDTGDKGDPGTGVPEGGTPGQLLSKTEDGTAWVDPPSTGNVLTSTATGYVAHAEDAYAQKPIEVRVKGRTVKNLWPAINTTNKGVTVATDDTGIVTVSGQNTASDNSFPYALVEGIVAGKQCTLTVSSVAGMTEETFCVYAQAHGAGGEYLDYFTVTTTPTTITLPAGTTSLRCGFIIRSGQSVNWSGRVMLVEGTEVPDCFTPPASITSVEPKELVTAGKNLANAENVVAAKGTTVSNADNSDGSFDVMVTTDGGYVFAHENVTINPGTYILSASVNGSSGIVLVFSNGQILANAGQSFTVDNIATVDLRYVQYYSIQGTIHVSGWQLERGSTATAYEPPDVTTTPLPEVELRGLPNGTCDELVIKADGTCEVERRTFSVTVDGSEDEMWSEIGNSATHGGRYFDLVMNDSPVYADGVSFSAQSQVANRLEIQNGDGFINTVGVYTQENLTRFRISLDGVTTKAALLDWLQANPTTVVYETLQPATEPQSSVMLPALPAPTFDAYHDSDVPSDTSIEYARDINIVIDNLAKQIAGTAATVAVNEATR